MDGTAASPICDEDHVTDSLLEKCLHEDEPSNMMPRMPMQGAPGFKVAAPRNLSFSNVTETTGLSPFMTLAASASSPPSSLLQMQSVFSKFTGMNVMTRVSRHNSVSENLPMELSTSQITSDDSGDFEFLTRDVHDAQTYDLIRRYLLHSKQQEKDLAELEAECTRLEAEEKQLYMAAVVNSFTQRRVSVSQGQADGSSPDKRAAIADAVASAAVAEEDEFGERDIDPRKACPYGSAAASGRGTHVFRYGAPGIDGKCVALFKEGLLFCCTTAEGSWVFHNDTQQYKMEVRYLFGGSSTIRAGPHASLRQVESGDYEAQVTVWPQETEVLVVGDTNGYRNLSKAVPVDATYVNPHTAASIEVPSALLRRCARQLGKSSAARLTTEDVLQFCLQDRQGRQQGQEPAATEKIHFVDPSFPPSRASLYRNGVDSVFVWDMPWKRPEAYLPAAQKDEACLFAQLPLPSDPVKGDGGDAYFCSAAAILAEFPERVCALFRHQDSVSTGKIERAMGAYQVTLNHGGWWTTTTVDNYLPASFKGPDLGRCTHDVRKLWYPLLEKAYAKLHGSYAAIQGGDPVEALQDVTGFPAFRFDEEWAEMMHHERLATRSSGGTNYYSGGISDAAERVFSLLEEKVHQRKYVVCLGLPDESSGESMAPKLGLAYGMSYAVLRLVRHGKHRLVQVRCTAPRSSVSTMWCAESTRWRRDPKLAQLCGMDCRDAGELVGGGGGVTEDLSSFWLDWLEAMAIFDGGGVCCCRWDWAYDCRVRGVFDDGVPSVALEITVLEGLPESKAVEAYCVLSQDDDRALPPSHPNRPLLPLMLCVSSYCGKDEAEEAGEPFPADQRLRHVCSIDPDTPTTQLTYIVARDTALRVTLLPSPHPYYVIPRCLGEMHQKRYTVGVVSSTPVTATGFFRLRAVQLSASAPIFRDRREFSTVQPMQMRYAPSATFQVRGPDGRVREGCGSNIV